MSFTWPHPPSQTLNWHTSEFLALDLVIVEGLGGLPDRPMEEFVFKILAKLRDAVNDVIVKENLETPAIAIRDVFCTGGRFSNEGERWFTITSNESHDEEYRAYMEETISLARKHAQWLAGEFDYEQPPWDDDRAGSQAFTAMGALIEDGSIMVKIKDGHFY